MILDFINETDIELDDEIVSELENVISKTLEKENFSYEAEVSLSIVKDDEIRELNKKYRKLDKETDVLSFPLLEFDDVHVPIEKVLEPVALGDIIISIETAERQAEEYGHSLIRELAFLSVHSALHLLGYDHSDEESSSVMFKKQEAVLREAGISR